MMLTHPFNEWLDRVNSHITADDGKVRMRSFEERRDPNFTPNGVAQPRNPVDLVVEGPCSIMDRLAMMDLEWLRDTLEHHPEAKRVALFPCCCGGDFSGDQAHIRQSFPGIDFIFLDVPDLYSQVDDHWDQVVYAAINAEIVYIVKLE